MMLRRTLALSSLLLMSGCAVLDPVAAYRAAAQQLHFALERVEPKLELEFPLDRSRVRFRFEVGVTNDSDLRLHARGLTGKLSLESDGELRPLGEVGLPNGFDVEAKGKATVPLDLALTYADVQSIWRPLMNVLQHHHEATWRLDGTANLEALGVGFNVPIRSSKHVNS